MADRHATMMDPPVESPARSGRLEVHPGDPGRHAGQADQLVLQPAGRGSGRRSCPLRSPRCPASRCPSPWRRSRPGKITYQPARPGEGRTRRRSTATDAGEGGPGRDRGRDHSASARAALSRAAASCSGCAGASPLTRRSRCAGGWSTRAPTSSPCSRPGRDPVRRRRSPSRPWRPSRFARSLWDEPEPIPHTRLGQAADLIVVAPATARVIGAYAAGISDDLLTATLLATRAPVLVCPAMHTEMWEHPAVQENLADARAGAGCTCVEPDVGPAGRWRRRGRAAGRAGGDRGGGRRILADRGAGRTRCRAGPMRPARVSVVVTAGGTREPIDPVRFIGNRSSGKQGYAVAAAAAARGASVILVTTTDRPVPDRRRPRWCAVETAAEMRARGDARPGRRCDVVVMAAAVADFRPKAGRRPQAEEGRRDSRGGPRADHRHPGRPRAGHAVPVRCWWASRPRPSGRLGQEPAALRREKLAAQRRSTWWSPTTCAAPGAGFGHDTNARPDRLGGDGAVIDSAPGRPRNGSAAAVVDAIAARLGRRPSRPLAYVAGTTRRDHEPLDVHLGIGHGRPSGQDGRPDFRHDP